MNKANSENLIVPESCLILKMKVHVLRLSKCLNHIQDLIALSKPSYVCVSNVHMCMETNKNASFENIINKADLVVADGRPIYFAQKLLGFKHSEQIRGENLTLELCKLAAQNDQNIGFIGGNEITLKKMKENLQIKYPKLKIPCLISPPFRPLKKTEINAYINELIENNVKVLFVALGCPKQEAWMHENSHSFPGVMIGIGAAIEFIAGSKKKAPTILQNIGLEWLVRLIDEPKRLIKRYFPNNFLFLLFFSFQLIKNWTVKKPLQ
jgi:N-acetylglucosaminyldiphosphoundecaprenol N-acetyl-beta-D-mannosaminyltransferase